MTDTGNDNGMVTSDQVVETKLFIARVNQGDRVETGFITAAVNSSEGVETGFVPDTHPVVAVVKADLYSPTEGGEKFTATVTTCTGDASSSGSPTTARDFLSRVVAW